MDEVGPDVSLAAFAQKHGLSLTRFGYLVTGDRGRAEDLVQDVLLAMHRRFGPSLPLADPVAYARRAVVNAHLTWVRRHRLAEIPSAAVPELPSVAVDGSPRDDDVWGVLAGLPPRQRAVLVLRYYVGYSDAEIAALLACREGSVRSLAARAFQALRPVLRPPATSEGVSR